MKRAILAGLLILPSLLFGQLRGTYCHEFGSGKAYINFENDRFYFYTYCCTGASIGKGKYEVKSDSLFFKFENLKVPSLQNKVKIVKERSVSDTIKMKFFTRDIKTREKLENCCIILVGSKNEMLAGGTTDNNGKWEIKYPRSNDSITIIIKGPMFYRKFSTKLSLKNNYRIEIKLVSDYINHYFKSWESYGVKIQNMNINSFELQDKYQQSFSLYHKCADHQFPKW